MWSSGFIFIRSSGFYLFGRPSLKIELVNLNPTVVIFFQLQHEVTSRNGFRMDLMKANKSKKLLGATFITPVLIWRHYVFIPNA